MDSAPTGDGGFRSRIRRRELLLGAFANMGSATASELLGRAGFDCVIIDLEHGLGTEATLVDEIRAVECGGATAVVRIEENLQLRTSRALDQGAAGIIFPRIESAEQAALAVSHVRYPPAGIRGVALSTRSSGFGSRTHDEMGDINDHVACVVQVETLAGLEEAPAIAKVDGVDMLFVGPSDLSHSLGVPGALHHPAYKSALERITAATSEAEVACGIMIQDVDELDRHAQLGFTFFVLGTDSGFLTRAARAASNNFREQAEIAQPAAGAPAS